MVPLRESDGDDAMGFQAGLVNKSLRFYAQAAGVKRWEKFTEKKTKRLVTDSLSSESKDREKLTKERTNKSGAA
jgi:hypothetical protein